jgi:hypothetical protein
MSVTEAKRLNSLAKLNSSQKYLEVGVCTGETFLQIDVPFKVGVDPNFAFRFQDCANENTMFCQVASDQFWSNFFNNQYKFDLIYLDGLHTFEQTFRDFCASLNHSHDSTIWLLDDTCPIGWFAAHPDPVFVGKARKFLKINETFWMGDVFKVILAIHDFFPQFSYATFPGHGQTVVWKESRENFNPTWNSLQKISKMGYYDFLKIKDSHLNVKDDELTIFNRLSNLQIFQGE